MMSRGQWSQRADERAPGERVKRKTVTMSDLQQRDEALFDAVNEHPSPSEGTSSATRVMMSPVRRPIEPLQAEALQFVVE